MENDRDAVGGSHTADEVGTGDGTGDGSFLVAIGDTLVMVLVQLSPVPIHIIALDPKRTFPAKKAAPPWES